MNCALGLAVGVAMLHGGALLVALGGWFVDYVAKVNLVGGPTRRAYARVLRRPMGVFAGILALIQSGLSLGSWAGACELLGASVAHIVTMTVLTSAGLTAMIVIAVAGRVRVGRWERVAVAQSKDESSDTLRPPGRAIIVDWAGRGRVVMWSVAAAALGMLSVVIVYSLG